MEEEIVINNAIKPENISAAVAVGFSWPSISSKLIENLVDLAIKKADVGTCEKIIDFDINTKGSKFYITKSGWDKYSICFEFDSCNVNDFCYGVMTLPSHLEENFSEEKRKLLCDEFVVEGLYAGKKSPTWPWWNYFDVPYRDWSKSDVPWIGIREGGKTVDIIADKIIMLMSVCERENSKTNIT